MKTFIILLLSLLSISAYSKKKKASSFEFLKKEALKSNKNYTYNKYENIINGSAAFIIGNAGYYSTDSQTLKLSYSMVQTIGILNIGKGIYDYYRPIQDKELYFLLKKNKKSMNREKMATDIIEIFAKEERAKRLQLLWSSTFLATQYFINSVSGDTQKDLKEIYKFLGGINLIVIGYSYFYKSKYESFYYDKRKNLSFFPAIFKTSSNKTYAGLAMNYTF
ncbi:MAG: hypothetical protein N4A33_02500 [Bacteriovoracaceae bacterium]|jgi:hypothetical protein|nr:hypothetical protein [Bacteriovoracaceae bacterium]